MRYEIEMELNLPREKVIDIFLDAENLPKWQPSLVSFEHLSGEPRQVGAKTRQIHKMGQRETVMIETITESNFPDTYAATYEGGGVCNMISNRFIESSPQTTKWVLASEFKCRGLLKLLTVFFPGMFKSQTLTFMNYFKEFAEKQK